MQAKRIGVFDSGFGGLDVFREIQRVFPEYDYMYLADTARAPYGSLSSEEVHGYTTQAVEFLFEQDCGLIIIACNTASSDALHHIQLEQIRGAHADARILGVLIPAAEEAAARTSNGRVGVIGTVGTVASNSFPRELHKIRPELQVFQNACPLLVPLVESGEHRASIVRPLIETYVAPLLKESIDTLVLGCTHYAILKDAIRDVVGPDIAIVSQTEIVPPKLREYLQRHTDLRETLSLGSTVRFCTTDPTDRFQELGSVLFGAPIAAEKVALEPTRAA